MAPFSSPHEAIAFVKYCNPARQKAQNLFEPERGGQITVAQFSGEHPHDIFASVVGALRITQKAFGNSKEWKAFSLWYLDKSIGEKFSKEDLAQLFGVKKRQVNRYLECVMGYFADELFDRELLSYELQENQQIH